MIEGNNQILDKIDKLQVHFYNYLFTKTVRDISSTVTLSEKDWDFIQRLEGQKSLLYGRRNFKIEEIYLIIIPFVEFIKKAKKEILPNIKSIVDVNTPRLSFSPQEKSIRKILTDNYENNIVSLGRIILELYDLAVEEDLKEHVGKTPLCLTMKEIKNIEESLRFIEEYPTFQK